MLHWHCNDCNKNVVGVFKLIKMVWERQDKMKKDVAELKKEMNCVKKSADKASTCVQSDKDAICEILSEALKLEGSRHVEEVF